MKLSRRNFLKKAAVAGAGLALAGCAPTVVKETVVVEKVVKETVIVAGTPQVVKETVIVEGTPQVVEKVVEKIVTAVPEPAPRFAGKILVSTRATSDIDPQKSGQDALVAAYKEVQPDVEVVFEMPPAGHAGGYGAWVTTQLAAGAIRLDIVSGVDAGTYDHYLNFEKYRYAYNPYAGMIWDDAFNFGRFKWTNAKGQRYGLAAAAGEVYWYCNKTLLNAAGLNPPDYETITWSGFVDLCAKVEAAKVAASPIFINWAWHANQWMSGVYFDQYHLDWVETVRAQPGDWCYDPDIDGAFKFDPNDKDIHGKYTYSGQRYFQGIRDGKLRFDTPAFSEMIDNLSQAWSRYAQEGMFISATDGYAEFLSQQCVFFPSGTWLLAPLKNDLEELTAERREALKLPEDVEVEQFEWDIFSMPTMEGPLVQCKAKNVAGQGDAYVSIIEKNQAQIDLCMDFVMFWYSKSGMQPYYDARMAAGWPGMGAVDVYGVTYPAGYQELLDRVKPMGNAELNQNNWEFFSNYESNENVHVMDLRNKYQEALERKITGADFSKWLQNYWTDNWDDLMVLKGMKKEALDNPAREPGM